jgi:hypothetical protein
MEAKGSGSAAAREGAAWRADGTGASHCAPARLLHLDLRGHGSRAQQIHSANSQHCTARHYTARHGTARHGTARHGTARHGTARHSHSTAQSEWVCSRSEVALQLTIKRKRERERASDRERQTETETETDGREREGERNFLCLFQIATTWRGCCSDVRGGALC